MKNVVLHGDCLEKLKNIDGNSVESIVTDPPYELGFMGKAWDNTGIANNKEMWAECLRVLKPGGYLLSFGGTRTYHRMACAIEDAGFEVRDMIEWCYGSGFPKSLNIGKAVDKINGETGRLLKFVEWYRTTGMKQRETNEIIGKTDVGSHYLRLDQPSIPTRELWKILRPRIRAEIPQWVNDLIERIEKEREIVGINKNCGTDNSDGESMFGIGAVGKEVKITKGTSEWEGFGTALKPAHEPICMARKPLAEKTVAENVLKYRTGGINIDESRVRTEVRENQQKDTTAWHGNNWSSKPQKNNGKVKIVEGRFPANLIHDNCEEVRECFPNESEKFFASIIYQAKASKSDRGEGNNHPTVKPIALMEYLIKMVTPKGGIVLDPFAGSGSTLIAAKQNGYRYIGIEKEQEYIDIINKRILDIEPKLF